MDYNNDENYLLKPFILIELEFLVLFSILDHNMTYIFGGKTSLFLITEIKWELLNESVILLLIHLKVTVKVLKGLHFFDVKIIIILWKYQKTP